MYRIHFEHLYTLPLIFYDRLKMASIEVKQISSSCKSRMHVTVSVYEKIRQSVFAYIYVAHKAFCVYVQYDTEVSCACMS